MTELCLYVLVILGNSRCTRFASEADLVYRGDLVAGNERKAGHKAHFFRGTGHVYTSRPKCPSDDIADVPEETVSELVWRRLRLKSPWRVCFWFERAPSTVTDDGDDLLMIMDDTDTAGANMDSVGASLPSLEVDNDFGPVDIIGALDDAPATAAAEESTNGTCATCSGSSL